MEFHSLEHLLGTSREYMNDISEKNIRMMSE